MMISVQFFVYFFLKATANVSFPLFWMVKRSSIFLIQRKMNNTEKRNRLGVFKVAELVNKSMPRNNISHSAF